MVSEALGLSLIHPRVLEDAIIEPQEHEQLLADIHGRLLGLAKGKSARKSWLVALGRFMREFPEDWDRVLKGVCREVVEKERREVVERREDERRVEERDVEDEEEEMGGEERRWEVEGDVDSEGVGIGEDGRGEERPFRYEDVLADLGLDTDEDDEVSEKKASATGKRVITKLDLQREPNNVEEDLAAPESKIVKDTQKKETNQAKTEPKTEATPVPDETMEDVKEQPKINAQASETKQDVEEMQRINGDKGSAPSKGTPANMEKTGVDDARDGVSVQPTILNNAVNDQTTQKDVDEAKSEPRLINSNFDADGNLRLPSHHYTFATFEDYCATRMEVRVNILKDILERVTFEHETYLRAGKLEMQAWEMRVDDLGWDTNGNRYLYFYDGCRIYREPDPFLKAKAARRKERNKKKEKEKAIEKKEEGRKSKKSHRTPRRRARRSAVSYDEVSDVDEAREPQLDNARDDEGTDVHQDDEEPITYDEEIRRCDSWEIAVEGCEALRVFIRRFRVPPDPKLYQDRTLIKYFKQLLSGWEEEERRIQEEERRKAEEEQRSREKEEKKKEVEFLMTHQKRSSRLRAITEKKEEEKRRQEIVEQEKADREAKIRDTERMVERRIKALDRQRRKEMGVTMNEEEEEEITEESPEPEQQHTVRRSSRVRAKRETSPEAEKEEPSKPIREEKPIEQEEELEDIEPENLAEQLVDSRLNWQHLQEDIPTRLLDRFIFYDESEKPAKLEDVELDGEERIRLFGQGVLVPRINHSHIADGGEVSFPARVKLDHISEWCIEYGKVPRLWIQTKHAWYELRRPALDYREMFESARRKFEICSRLVILSGSMKAQEITYEKAIALLGMRYMDMKPNSESDILSIRDFIIAQSDALNNKSLSSSGFIRRLKKLKRDEEKGKMKHEKSEEQTQGLKRSSLTSSVEPPAKRQETASFAASSRRLDRQNFPEIHTFQANGNWVKENHSVPFPVSVHADGIINQSQNMMNGHGVWGGNVPFMASHVSQPQMAFMNGGHALLGHTPNAYGVSGIPVQAIGPQVQQGFSMPPNAAFSPAVTYPHTNTIQAQDNNQAFINAKPSLLHDPAPKGSSTR